MHKKIHRKAFFATHQFSTHPFDTCANIALERTLGMIPRACSVKCISTMSTGAPLLQFSFSPPSKIVFLTPGKKERNGFSPKSKWSPIFRSVISTIGFGLHRGIFEHWPFSFWADFHYIQNSLVLSKLFKIFWVSS